MPGAVFEVSQRIVKGISKRQEKPFRPRDEQGGVTRYRGEVDFTRIPFDTGKTWKILVRNNYLKKDIKDFLTGENLPFSDTGCSAYSEKLVQAIATWDRLKRGEHVPIEHAAVMYEYQASIKDIERGGKKKLAEAESRGVGAVSWKTLQENYGLIWTNETPWHGAFGRVDLQTRDYTRHGIEEYGIDAVVKPPIDVSTIHAAKGQEADHVVVVCDMAARCWRELERNRDSELRVWYVGVTRAREHLHVVGDNGVV